jgi:CRISPR-associated protein Cmr4
MTEAPTTNPQNASQQEAALLFIHAQTSLHPGSGTALGTVDLPVQRERHTQWPVIPGSSLKGILRDACRPPASNAEAREDWLAAFGPETAEADKHAGALSLTDARILAFPVRSLRGVFAWITCSAVLERLQRDLRLGQSDVNAFRLPTGPGKDKALCRQNSPLLVDGNKLVLEEFEFECTGDADEVATWVSKRAVADNTTENRLKDHLVVLHDDDFTHFVRHATEVVARIALDYERKTVKGTALFYEEFLPAETLFYSVVLASASRREGHGKSASEILKYLRDNLPPILQIGGDETIGKGLCAVRLDNGKDGAQCPKQ